MDKREFIESFLDDSEKNSIQQFIGNKKMKQAVKKVLLSGAYQSGVLKKGKPADNSINFAMTVACQKASTPEQVGRDIKACWEGINIVELAFDDLELFKEVETPKERSNQAR